MVPVWDHERSPDNVGGADIGRTTKAKADLTGPKPAILRNTGIYQGLFLAETKANIHL